MMKRPQLIHAGEVTPQPWRNGAGRTRELLTWPAGAQPWQLRISLAEISRDGPFSLYPGIERWISVIEGAGVRLLLEGREHRLDRRGTDVRIGSARRASVAQDGLGREMYVRDAGHLQV